MFIISCGTQVLIKAVINEVFSIFLYLYFAFVFVFASYWISGLCLEWGAEVSVRDVGPLTLGLELTTRETLSKSTMRWGGCWWGWYWLGRCLCGCWRCCHWHLNLNWPPGRLSQRVWWDEDNVVEHVNDGFIEEIKSIIEDVEGFDNVRVMRNWRKCENKPVTLLWPGASREIHSDKLEIGEGGVAKSWMWLALGQGQVDRRRKVHLYESPPVFKLPPGSSIDDMI